MLKTLAGNWGNYPRAIGEKCERGSGLGVTAGTCQVVLRGNCITGGRVERQCHPPILTCDVGCDGAVRCDEGMRKAVEWVFIRTLISRQGQVFTELKQDSPESHVFLVE